MVLLNRLIPSFVWKIMIPLLIIRALPSLKNYEFSPKNFKSAAAKVDGSANGLAAVNSLVSSLRQSNRGAIPKRLYWISFSAGGLDLKAQFIYAGLMEYVAVFSAPFQTSGRSGFHWSNSTCTVLTGEVSRVDDYLHGNHKESFKPGSNFRHGEFNSHVYEMAADTYVACYGRGVMPVSALWAVTGAVSNGDPVPIIRLAFVYGEAHYLWLLENASRLWNRHAPPAWRYEL